MAVSMSVASVVQRLSVRRAGLGGRMACAAMCAAAVLCLWPGVAGADLADRAEAMINAADIRHTQVGLLVVDLNSSTTLASINPDTPMIPASNMKLLTTAAALQTLGPDFVFRTELRRLAAGSVPGLAGENLVIRGDGDPAFGDAGVLARHGLDAEKLIDAWVQAIKATGVKEFEYLLTDDRVFDQDFVPASWPAEQLNQWYCAQVAGINFNTNCLDIYLEPTTAGQSPLVKVWPLVPSLNMTNRAQTGNVETFWVSRRAGSNDMVFYGKVRSRRTDPVNVTIHDPPMFFGQLLQHRLGEAGVTVKHVARVVPEAQLPAGQVLHVVQTTLDQVLWRCNKNSVNLFAEALFKRMGHRITGRPGSWENGAAAMRMFLHDRLGVRSVSLTVTDGSGMSRENRVTARSLVEIMAAMLRDKRYAKQYLESLSIGGQDGTLARRFQRIEHGQVFGKSGYIRGVCTLSGVVVVPDENAVGGRRMVAFSILFNDFRDPVSLGQLQALQDRLVTMVYEDMVAQMTKRKAAQAAMPQPTGHEAGR